MLFLPLAYWFLFKKWNFLFGLFFSYYYILVSIFDIIRENTLLLCTMWQQETQIYLNCGLKNKCKESATAMCHKILISLLIHIMCRILLNGFINIFRSCFPYFPPFKCSSIAIIFYVVRQFCNNLIFIKQVLMS